MIERKHLSLEDFWRAFGISRATAFNWVKRSKPPPSKDHQLKLVEFFGEPREYVLFGRVDKSKISGSYGGELGEQPASPYIDSRTQRAVNNPEIGVGTNPMVVDPRFAIPGKPSGRKECEAYFLALMDAAQAEGDPDTFPAIMRRLRKHLPLDEFAPKEV